MKPIVNLADAPVTQGKSGERFECCMMELAECLGSKSIGLNVTRVPPGKAAFPLHHHHANEEHFFILRGTGILRFGMESYPVKPDDYIFTPPGGPELAHQFINTGDEDLMYLAISTMVLPEVVGYPDSDKTGVRVVTEGAEPPRFLILNASKSGVNYWDGEDGSAVAALTAAHTVSMMEESESDAPQV